MEVKRIRQGGAFSVFGAFSLLSRRCFVDAAGDGLQQLAGIVKISTPQERRALAGKAVGYICGRGVIGYQYALRRWCIALRSPQGCAGLSTLGPMNGGQGIGDCLGHLNW
jgi:hypothetical protein